MISYRSYTPDEKDVILEKDNIPLSQMTHIFRMSFWEVFSQVRIVDIGLCSITLCGAMGTVNKIFIFESANDRLSGTEGDDYIIYYRVDFPTTIGKKLSERLLLSTPAALSEREQIFSNDKSTHLASNLTGEFKGHRGWVCNDGAVNTSAGFPYLAAYYYYGWILSLRIERNQITQDISPHLNADDEIITATIKQRMRLINLERYFLSGQRSYLPSLQKAGGSLVSLFNLANRYESALSRHVAFESHVQNTAKALQARRASSLGKMVFLLTVLSVPLAAMQVLFGINLEASLYNKSRLVASDIITYAIIFAAISVVLIPLALLRIADYNRDRRDGRNSD
jgi:hypothetical protein